MRLPREVAQLSKIGFFPGAVLTSKTEACMLAGCAPGGPGDALPIRPEQATPLARSLGFTVAGLRGEYRRLTRRARRVVEHRFYDHG